MLTVADEQILRGATATITVTFVDQHGEPSAPGGTVTVQVVRADGTDVLAVGSSTTPGTPGVFKRTLTAAQTASLDLLTASWTNGTVAATTTVEVVGGYYFTLTEARRKSGLADDGAVPDATLIEKRREVEQECERIVGAAFVPRLRVVTVWGGGSETLHAPDPLIRTIRSVTFGGVALSAAALANIVAGADGTLTRYWPVLPGPQSSDWSTWGDRFPTGTRVALVYEHGMDRPPPDLKRATLRRMQNMVNAERSGIPDRAVTFTSGEGGTYSLATPGTRDWHTGIPEVDDVYGAYRDLYSNRPRSGSVPVG